MSGKGWGDWPPRSKPRRPENGIKAQSARGAFAAGIWAKRWIAVLEAFGLGTRLARGRSYARGGQVIGIALELGGVRAQVQGSRPKPYDVTIRVQELGPDDWRAVAAAIAGDVRLCAALLAGEMPEHIESAFAAAGTTLFPRRPSELRTACTCPDSANPCKHVAAVFYLIGEEFDRDPFLLFVVRGLPRDDVQALFSPAPDAAAREHPSLPEEPVAAGSSTVRVTGAAFWGETLAEPAVPRVEVSADPSAEAAVLRRAGKFPFWRGDVALTDAVAPLYSDAAAFALEWLAERADSRPHDIT